MGIRARRDVITILPSLTRGLDVNVKFRQFVHALLVHNHANKKNPCTHTLLVSAYHYQFTQNSVPLTPARATCWQHQGLRVHP